MQIAQIFQNSNIVILHVEMCQIDTRCKPIQLADAVIIQVQNRYSATNMKIFLQSMTKLLHTGLIIHDFIFIGANFCGQRYLRKIRALHAQSYLHYTTCKRW